MAFVLKGNTQEQVTSDLAPTVEPQAVLHFHNNLAISSAPLASGPIGGAVLMRIPNE